MLIEKKKWLVILRPIVDLDSGSDDEPQGEAAFDPEPQASHPCVSTEV